MASGGGVFAEKGPFLQLLHTLTEEKHTLVVSRPLHLVVENYKALNVAVRILSMPVRALRRENWCWKTWGSRSESYQCP